MRTQETTPPPRPLATQASIPLVRRHLELRTAEEAVKDRPKDMVLLPLDTIAQVDRLTKDNGRGLRQEVAGPPQATTIPTTIADR